MILLRSSPKVLCCLLQEVGAILGEQFPFELRSVGLDLPELQGEPEQISKEKCRLAAQQVPLGPSFHESFQYPKKFRCRAQ